MERRRVLLVFAVAAVATALATSATQRPPTPRPAEERASRPAAPAPPRPARREAVELRFSTAEGSPRVRTIRAGTHVVAVVEVESAGEVSVKGLGLVASATPRSPATFDVLAREAGRFELRFRPVAGPERSVGTLNVRP